jgi:hypothetical protein
MSSISGWVFVAVGASVTLFSNYVRNRGGEGLALFFWVGIIMIGVGIFKIVLGYIKEDKEEKNIPKDKFARAQINSAVGPGKFFGINKDLEDVGKSNIDYEKNKAVSQIQQNSILVCPMCATKHYSNSNFCHMCGQRLK